VRVVSQRLFRVSLHCELLVLQRQQEYVPGNRINRREKLEHRNMRRMATVGRAEMVDGAR